MKLAFSNTICPEWELDTLIDKAQAWGYAGVEITGADGHYESVSVDVGDPAVIRRTFEDAKIELLALHSGLSFAHLPRNTLENSKNLVREHLQLAAEVGCQRVVVSGATLPNTTTKTLALGQTGAALGELALDAAAWGVTLLFENSHAFASSADTWFLRDAGGAPSLRICWNAVNAIQAGDTLSLAVPRLAAAMGYVRLGDIRKGSDASRDGYSELGSGCLGVSKLVELLRGLAYSDWICVHWPGAAREDLPAADELLPRAAQYLRTEWTKPVIELSAYKGDKNAPRFASRASEAVATPRVT